MFFIFFKIKFKRDQSFQEITWNYNNWREKMIQRGKVIELLDKVHSKILQDGRFYSTAAENCKRLLFQNFFRKLAHQKRSFSRRIKYEIDALQKEKLLFEGNEGERKETELLMHPILPVFRTEREGLLKDCYRREKQNIDFYNSLLSRISRGQIREMLLSQKHSLQLILNEMESMGLRIVEDPIDEGGAGAKRGGEKNRGEKNLI